MKKALICLFAGCLLGVAAVTVAFEIFPDSSPARFLDPWCRSYYTLAREKTVEGVSFVRSKLFSSETERVENGASRENASRSEKASGESVDRESDGETDPKPTFADAKWYSRRRVRESDFRGKVVIGCVWRVDDPRGCDLLKNAQRIADGFKGKPLVVFASHRGGETPAVAAFLKKEAVTVPCCEGAGHPDEPRSAAQGPVYYMFDKSGKLGYFGRNDKTMTVRLVDLLLM